jgi:hypothetical protein
MVVHHVILAKEVCHQEYPSIARYTSVASSLSLVAEYRKLSPKEEG